MADLLVAQALATSQSASQSTGPRVDWLTVRRAIGTRLTVSLLLFATCAAFWRLLEPSPVSVPPQQELVFDDVTIVNPGGERLPHRRLVVRHGRIESIDAAPPGALPRYAGSYILPGLIDMHVHLPPWWAPGQLELFNTLFLAHGVTAIRELGSIDGRVFEVRREIQEGRRAGPRIFACGPLLDGDPPLWPLARIVRTAAEGRAAVDELVESRADCVEVYSRVSDDALQGIREAASAHRLPVVGHLPQSLPWGEIRIDDIQHVCDPRCPDLGPREIDELVETATRFGIAHTPTLVVYHEQLAAYDYSAAAERPAARLMPRFWREVVWNPRYGLGFSAPPAAAREMFQREQEALVSRLQGVVQSLHARGVRIHAGTDPFNPLVVPGASLHEELRLLEGAGLTTEEAWAAATQVAGEDLGEPRLGRLEPGAPADLLILRTDPILDPSALETLEAVVADGRLYPKPALDEALERQRRHFEGLLYDRISMAIARGVAELIRRTHG